ncbi:hypothetical protein M3Y99_01809100 [Aphelenchoides fujianensis]|nr:hypothetical protein M3Y99_01809100 [Aphelenchoides fujianensis]
MVLPDPSNCTAAESLGRNWTLNSVLFVHLVLSLVAIGLIAHLVFVSHRLNKFFALIHHNLKASAHKRIPPNTVDCRSFFTLAELSSWFTPLLITTLRSISVVNALRPDLSACDYQWHRARDCLVLKAPIYFCVFSFSATHFAVFIERCAATFGFRRYASCGRIVGILLLLLVFLFLPLTYSFTAYFFQLVATCSMVYYVYRNEELNAPRAYCLSTTPKSAPQLQQLMIIAALLDFVATAGDFAIRHANRRMKQTVRAEYSLAKSFQIRENQLSLRLIFPLSVVHSGFFLSYLVASIYLRSAVIPFDPLTHIVIIELLQTAVCSYLIIMLLSMLVLSKRLDSSDWLEPHYAHRRNEADLYFEQFRLQIGNPTSTAGCEPLDDEDGAKRRENDVTNHNVPSTLPPRFLCFKSARSLSIQPADEP